jgi:hypothetical protein
VKLRVEERDHAVEARRHHRQPGVADGALACAVRAGILWNYGSLIAIFREYGPNPSVEELARTVLERERLSAREAL